MRYVITFLRTESITMALDATNEQDARERFLSDGDEIDSRTLDLQVTDVDIEDAETCEDRGFRCCEAFPPPEAPNLDEYGEWYDAHVALYNDTVRECS